MPYVRGTEKLEVQLEQANLVSFAYPGRSKCYVTYNKWGLGDEVPNMVCYTLSPGVKHFRPPARALSQTHKSPCVAVLLALLGNSGLTPKKALPPANLFLDSYSYVAVLILLL